MHAQHWEIVTLQGSRLSPLAEEDEDVERSIALPSDVSAAWIGERPQHAAPDTRTHRGRETGVRSGDAAGTSTDHALVSQLLEGRSCCEAIGDWDKSSTLTDTSLALAKGRGKGKGHGRWNRAPLAVLTLEGRLSQRRPAWQGILSRDADSPGSTGGHLQ